MDKPDLLERLVNLHDYGLTDRERCEMRKEAAVEIRELRGTVGQLLDRVGQLCDRAWMMRHRVEQLEELNRFRVHHDLERPR